LLITDRRLPNAVPVLKILKAIVVGDPPERRPDDEIVSSADKHHSSWQAHAAGALKATHWLFFTSEGRGGCGWRQCRPRRPVSNVSEIDSETNGDTHPVAMVYSDTLETHRHV